MLLRFTKMHGLSNDFIVIDATSQDVELSEVQIRHLADRRLGIGCDQLLLIEPPEQPDIDFNYRIFNADGKEVEQCGNGARCLGKYVFDKRLTGKQQIKVSTCNRILNIDIIRSNLIRVDMGSPRLAPVDIPLQANEQQPTYLIEHSLGNSEVGAVSMGNPHAVLIVDNVDDAPVNTLGPVLECHPHFPNKVNVGFMQIVSPKEIKLRVFERGVGETSACGTGACAAVVFGQLQGLLEHQVKVHLRGGELDIEWQGNDSAVLMTGSAAKVFDGKIKL